MSKFAMPMNEMQQLPVTKEEKETFSDAAISVEAYRLDWRYTASKAGHCCH
jgi:hypothetical protein